MNKRILSDLVADKFLQKGQRVQDFNDKNEILKHLGKITFGISDKFRSLYNYKNINTEKLKNHIIKRQTQQKQIEKTVLPKEDINLYKMLQIHQEIKNQMDTIDLKVQATDLNISEETKNLLKEKTKLDEIVLSYEEIEQRKIRLDEYYSDQMLEIGQIKFTIAKKRKKKRFKKRSWMSGSNKVFLSRPDQYEGKIMNPIVISNLLVINFLDAGELAKKATQQLSKVTQINKNGHRKIT